MRIGVTGGCGYLASVLVPQLVSNGHEVDSLDILPPETGLLAKVDPKKFKYHPVDISIESNAKKTLGTYDCIIHLAALVGYPACEKDPVLAEKWNVDTMRNVLRYKRKSANVLFSSTISNYGAQTSKVTEETPTHPTSVYGKTKKAAEDLLMAEEGNIIFRFAGAFGVSPKMRHDNLIHDFVHQATSGEPLSIYESSFIRQFIHVRDMAGAIVFAVTNWSTMRGNIFNVGNPAVEITKKELVERIAKHYDFEYRFENSGTDLEKRDYPISFEKLIKTGFVPKMNLDAGIVELLGYYTQSQSSKELAYGR